MADERDEDQFGETEGKSSEQATGHQGQQSELGQQQGQQSGGAGSQSTMSNQGSEGSFGGQSQTDGMSVQPIGGNDSNTGSGTTLSQGAEFGGQSSTGQAQSGGG